MKSKMFVCHNGYRKILIKPIIINKRLNFETNLLMNFAEESSSFFQ